MEGILLNDGVLYYTMVEDISMNDEQDVRNIPFRVSYSEKLKMSFRTSLMTKYPLVKFSVKSCCHFMPNNEKMPKVDEFGECQSANILRKIFDFSMISLMRPFVCSLTNPLMISAAFVWSEKSTFSAEAL